MEDKERKRLLDALDFYRKRVDALQALQSRFRDPERTMVCDILANGSLLEQCGSRYNVKS